ncbi:MAG: prolipoprotein diacylglyceryl transferase [Verrucomicrobia bacterium]|nr:prolipoprotein diacylglyceryl transferase [Verrucomicrobiota bacterium]
MLSFIFWDPAREMFSFNLPFLGRPILWYGFFFALGFLLGYFLFVNSLKRIFPSKTAKELAEKALVYGVIGVIMGARLGDVFFYQDFHVIRSNPWIILQPWQGGLASHGGVVGLVIALALFFKKERSHLSKLSFIGFLDFVCLPSAIIAGFIRIGNFFNQEILGTQTTLPFGVIFGHPADGSFPTPRHPVQIYESLFYFFLGFLFYLHKKDLGGKKQGKTLGLFLILVFGFRFLIEYLKTEQSALIGSSILTMGQFLSIPFILAGLALLYKTRKVNF